MHTPPTEEEWDQLRHSFAFLIQTIRVRTPMWIGDRSIKSLGAFLTGWEIGTDRIDDASFRRNFECFVCERLADGSSRGSILLTLQAEDGDEEAALDRYFEVYDDYCRVMAERPSTVFPDPDVSAERALSKESPQGGDPRL